MKTLPKLAMVAVMVSGLALAGCDSAAENQTEDIAEALDESYEAEADMVEAIEEGGPAEEAAEEEADAIREEGEELKDNLEDAADDMDSTPQ